jgi:hypothetical protein
MEIKFTWNDKGKPPAFVDILSHDRRKLADCELRFDDGLFAGLKVQGFTIWERTKERNGLPIGNLSVMPPNFRERTYKGGRSSVAFIRPIEDDSYDDRCLPKGPLATTILEAFKSFRTEQRGSQLAEHADDTARGEWLV